MEPENSFGPVETGGVGGPAVTLGTKGNGLRPDAVILDELEEAARRVDPARLWGYLGTEGRDDSKREPETMTPDQKASKLRDELTLFRRYCPVLDRMFKHGLPLDLETYLALAYPDRDFEKEPLDSEEASMVPRPFWPEIPNWGENPQATP